MTRASPSSSVSGAGQRRRQWAYTAVLVTAVLLAAGLAMPALAQSGNDTDGPTLSAAERGNETTIVVTITDDQDVDESSISLSDFDVGAGLLGNATVEESGSNAVVELVLVSTLDTDNVTVSLAGSITDTTGNTVSSGSATATGMDSRQPRLLGFTVDRRNDTHARLAVETTEPLSRLTLAIGGANADNLVLANFTETIRNSNTLEYARVHEFDEEGESRLLLMQLADEAGNAVGYNARRNYLVDRTPPTASIDGPSSVTTGDTHTFASDADDNVKVESVRWSIEPNTTRAGRSIEYAFTEPGNRTLAVRVTDGRNRTATVRHNVTVRPGASKDGVDVTPVAADRTNATVYADRVARRVRVADERGHLVSRDGVTVEALSVTPPANESIRLSATVSGQASAFTTATGRRSVAAISIGHPSTDTAENVTVAFAVDRLRLQAAGLAPEEVSLYRHNETWRELPTRVRWGDAERVHFTADSPGLSTFAIGASNQTATGENGTNAATNESESGATANGTGGANTTESDDTDTSTATASDTEESASLVVTAATLAEETVVAGEYAVVTATVANEGGRTGSRTVALTGNGSTLANRTVTVQPGENRSLQFASRVDQPITLAVGGTTAGTVTVRNDSTSASGASRTRTQSESATSSPTPVTDGSSATDEPSDASTVNATTTGGGGGLPNPLALWPGGIVGLVTVSYGVLKAIAMYLGY